MDIQIKITLFVFGAIVGSVVTAIIAYEKQRSRYGWKHRIVNILGDFSPKQRALKKAVLPLLADPSEWRELHQGTLRHHRMTRLRAEFDSTHVTIHFPHGSLLFFEDTRVYRAVVRIQKAIRARKEQAHFEYALENLRELTAEVDIEVEADEVTA